MKKKIIIFAFCFLIFITAILFIKWAVYSYNYDMNPDNGVDLLEGIGAVFIAGIGAFVVFYELDLFYTTYYFFIKSRTKIKSILNIICNLSLVLIFVYCCLPYIFTGLRVFEITPLILFFIYVILRMIYLNISIHSSDREE